MAEHLGDTENLGLAHLYLGAVLDKAGRWPESIAEMNRARGMLGEVRGGSRAAYLFVARARPRAEMGRFAEAAADLEQARARVQKLKGEQSQLRARIDLAEAEAASYRLDWREALRFARLARGRNGGAEENFQARLLEGAAMIETGMVEAGAAACRDAIRGSTEKSLLYVAAPGKLALAEALWRARHTGEAGALAQDALAFFEPRQIWEAVWRCYRVIGGGNPARTQAAVWRRPTRIQAGSICG